jgi:hypothetical protein
VWKKAIMKKSLSWRLFILVAGTLFGLLAGMGLSAPAIASPVQVATDWNYHGDDEDLTLSVNRDGKLKVVGENYDSNKVYVQVVQINHNGKQKIIDERNVWTQRGDFKYVIQKGKCDNSYQAYSYSKKDGWDKSDKMRIRCDKGGHHSY